MITRRTLILALLLCISGCQSTAKPATKAKADEPPPRTLYDRIGGEATIVAFVDDLIERVMADPAVNFTRTGTTRPWRATPAKVAQLKARLIQFFGTATGGPQQYEGEDLRTAHRGMQISAAQFDAFVKDVAASLEHVGVKEKERKEMLEVLQSARGSIVETGPRIGN